MMRTTQAAAALLLLALVGACGNSEGSVAASNPQPESGEMVATPSDARPGGILDLTFPTSAERGEPFFLFRWKGTSWGKPAYLLISDATRRGTREASRDLFWADRSEDWAWNDIGVGGPGPDRVKIPEAAKPGLYRICTANTRPGSELCAQVRVTQK
jgi:hypothetical protein